MNFFRKIFGTKPPLNKTTENNVTPQLTNQSELKFSNQVNRNMLGKENEQNGNLKIAIKYYEKNIEEGFVGNHPYDRLAIIYRKNKDYENETRVLNRAIEIFHELSKTSSRGYIKPKLEKFQERLIKVEKLKKR